MVQGLTGCRVEHKGTVRLCVQELLCIEQIATASNLFTVCPVLLNAASGKCLLSVISVLPQITLRPVLHKIISGRAVVPVQEAQCRIQILAV